MEQRLRTNGLPKETVAAVMMLYKYTKVKVHSPDGDTNYFDIVAGVLQQDTLAPCMFIICLDNVLRMYIDIMKDYGFMLAKEIIITDVDSVDDIVLLANTPVQAETLLHCLEW